MVKLSVKHSTGSTPEVAAERVSSEFSIILLEPSTNDTQWKFKNFYTGALTRIQQKDLAFTNSRIVLGLLKHLIAWMQTWPKSSKQLWDLRRIPMTSETDKLGTG